MMSVDFSVPLAVCKLCIGGGKIAVIAHCGGFWSAICIGCGVFNH